MPWSALFGWQRSQSVLTKLSCGEEIPEHSTGCHCVYKNAQNFGDWQKYSQRVYSIKEGTGVQENPSTPFTRPYCLPLYVCACVCMHVPMHLHTCLCVHMCAVYKCMQVYPHMAARYTHACTAQRVCMCIHVCMCMYVCTGCQLLWWRQSRDLAVGSVLCRRLPGC